MSLFAKKIFKEAFGEKESTENYFSKRIPHFYAFIERDVTYYPLPQDKWKIINELETYRVDAKSLPVFKVKLNMLIATQMTIEKDRIEGALKSNKPLFVVKMHNLLYLLDGHHRCTGLLSKNVKECNAYVLDLDKRFRA